MISPYFNFFLLSTSASLTDDSIVKIRDVVTQLELDGPQTVELCGLVGVVLHKANRGCPIRVEAEVCVSPEDGPQPLPDATNIWYLPEAAEIDVISYKLPIHLACRGLYCVRLIDILGSFGAPGEVLANYTFFAAVK